MSDVVLTRAQPAQVGVWPQSNPAPTRRHQGAGIEHQAGWSVRGCRPPLGAWSMDDPRGAYTPDFTIALRYGGSAVARIKRRSHLFVGVKKLKKSLESPAQFLE